MSPTPDQWEEARAAFEAGDSARAIARRLGLHHSAITRQTRRQGWSLSQVGAGGAGGAPARSGAAGAPDDEEAPTRPNDLGPLLAGDAEPPLDLTNPAHQQAIVDAAMGIRRGAALEDHLDQLLAEEREQRAERLGLRGLGWISHAPF